LPDRGSYQSLESIGRADLLALKERVFARSALKIAVVGAISAETLAGLIDKTFGALPELARLTPVGLIEPQGVGSKDVILLDVPQSVIRFGTSGPRRNGPDYMPAFVVNHILGGGVFSARLFKEVREKRGLAYSVHSSLVCFDATGLLVGGTATKNERAGESLGVIEEQIALMAESGPTAEELALAKKYLTGSYALRFDTSTKIAGQLVQIQLDDLGIDYIDRRNIEVNEVTLARACEAAADLFGRSKLAVTVVGQPQGL
jgi:zinc protease